MAIRKNTALQKKLTEIYDKLFQVYGLCQCPLDYETPFQLLVAVVLSAQCTDIRVNIVTKELFAKYGTVEKFAAAKVEDIAQIIKSVGLYQTKSRNLHAASLILRDKFQGVVPMDMDDLLSLPGVGRKSANAIRGNAFNIPGFPADTHVQRLLMRLGIIKERNPELAEDVVCRNLPEEYWTNFSHLLIFHGRAVCHARTPECGRCVLNSICKGAEL